MAALPFAGERFDVVLCLEGIEHVCRSEACHFLSEARRVLRPGGLLVLTAPCLRDGKHSGNPYHLYEFAVGELEKLVERWFDIESTEASPEPEPGIRLVCRRRPEARVARPSSPFATDMISRALAWLRTMQEAAAFRFSNQSPPTLISTAVAVLVLEGAGELDSVPDVDRLSIVQYLRDCQDPDTGLFLDPLVKRFPIESADHNREYFDYQCTYFALQALDALGVRPAHSLRFLDSFVPAAAVRWLDELDWSNPWLESNRVMFVLASLIHRAEVEDNATAPVVFHSMLDWLDRAQDPRTGFWWEPGKTSVLNAMAGAFHFLPFFHYVNRPVTHMSKLASACLALQHADAMFAPGPGGGACEDMDAICILAMIASEPNPQPAAYKRALIRAFWAIWNLQTPGGGFPYAGRPTGETYRFGGWAGMEAQVGGGDVFATWFRLTSLAMISRLYPEDLPQLGQWRFRRWPALGYFPGFKERGTDHHALWARPFRKACSSVAAGNPRVTVVVPCHNLGAYLFEAIQSVLDQEEIAAEIIVIDDGSKDEFTSWYVRNLRAPGLRTIYAHFGNVAAARNSAIEAAAGEYICCLDADDRLKPGFLRRTVQVLGAQPSTGFVSCHYETFDEESATYRMNSCRLPDMLARNEAAVVSLFRKAAWRKVGGYSTALTGMHDWDFWIAILEAGYDGAVVPEVLFEYRKRRGSMYTVTSGADNFVRLVSTIVARHRATYERWFVDVLRLKTRDFIELLHIRDRETRVHAEKTASLERQVAQLNLALDDASASTKLIEEARDWWRRNSESWQAAAERHGAECARLQMDLQSSRHAAHLSGLEGEFIAESSQAKQNPAMLRGHLDAELRLPLNLFEGGFWGPSVLFLLGFQEVRSKLKNLALWRRLVQDSTASRFWRRHFSPGWYLSRNADVGRAGVAPHLHFLLQGFSEGRDPGPDFSCSEYLLARPDVAAAGLNPLLHYALFGRRNQ